VIVSLQSKIIEDWKKALKNREPQKDCLSLIITELKNRAIKDNVSVEGGRTVTDEIALEVLQKMAKQRREAMEAFKNAQRRDLEEKEQFELSVIEAYLPKPLHDDELRSIVSKIIHDIGATSNREMGQVMGHAMKMVQGRADGKRVQAMVQTLLGGR
jgi:uncharacterized protein YqeY